MMQACLQSCERRIMNKPFVHDIMKKNKIERNNSVKPITKMIAVKLISAQRPQLKKVGYALFGGFIS